MSDYVKIKALRVPLAKYGYEEDPYKIESENERAFSAAFGVDGRFFDIVCTNSGTYYLDYVLDTDHDCYGEYYKSRELYQKEQERYEGMFKQLLPKINMNDVHLVEYCWYNCSEPDDCYSTTTDPFYEEV